jgi:long-chain acyl-CoA synthetase
VVVLGHAAWSRVAHSCGWTAAPASLEAVAAHTAAPERIRALTSSFPHYAQPRAVGLTLEPWTIENGLMTPTLKLERNDLALRFGEPIDALNHR